MRGDEFRVNTTTLNKQLHPVVGADGAGRLLVVWTSFSKGPGADLASFNLHAQAYDAIRPVPAPAPPFVTSNGSGMLTVAWPSMPGFNVARYEVFVEGLAAPLISEGNHVVIHGLHPGQSYVVSMSYVLADGRRSPVSTSVSHATWGVDANNDGIPDDWQLAHFGPAPKNGSWPSPDDDYDGDGASNLAEFRAGTDPKNPNSVLKSHVISTAGQLRFQWNTRVGFMYQVQISTNLVDWANYGQPRFAAGEADMIPIGRERNAAYYRVILAR